MTDIIRLMHEQYAADCAMPDGPSVEPANNPYAHASGPHGGADDCPACAWEAPAVPQWSVLLLYPDYVSQDAPETYFTVASGATVREAVAAARQQCLEANGWTVGEEVTSLDDFAVLLVIAGNHQDRSYEADTDTTSEEPQP